MEENMLGLYSMVILSSFIGALGALYVYSWIHDDHDWEWPEVDWNWLKRLFPPEIGIGLVAILLINAAFVAVMRTGEYAVTGQYFLVVVDSVVALLLGLASIAAFLLATRRWWKKEVRHAWTPTVFAVVWATTAGYLLIVGVMAGWAGDLAWGVFNALGAAASAAFALPFVSAAMYAKRAQRKALTADTLATAPSAE